MATTDERLSILEQQVSAVTAKVDTFIQEMRDRDNQRAAELIEIRQRQDAAQAKHEADIKAAQEKHDADIKAMDKKFDAKFDALTKQLHDNFIQTLLGVGGMMLALGALLFTALRQ
ncbi:MAG: hypothetical protein IJS69_03795 [Selenomonadaceae bacterium]|nr:hypothetical protein [Selenomonadaceae bacterium]